MQWSVYCYDLHVVGHKRIKIGRRGEEFHLKFFDAEIAPTLVINLYISKGRVRKSLYEAEKK